MFKFAVAFDSATRTHAMSRREAVAYLTAAVRTHPGAHLIRFAPADGTWVVA